MGRAGTDERSESEEKVLTDLKIDGLFLVMGEMEKMQRRIISVCSFLD